MKMIFRMTSVALLCAAFTSCIKEEALNAECDIEQAFVSIEKPGDVFYNVNDTLVNIPSTTVDIVFRTKRKPKQTVFAPKFRLTEGATITPANGSAHDFGRGPVVYTVTSEDGNSSRVYRVSFQGSAKMVGDVVKFDFENVAKDNLTGLADFYKWQEKGPNGMEDLWGTGNAGFSLSAWDQPIDADPTIPINGMEGKGVQMTTRSTGALGKMVKKPIAAGNLFYGAFDLQNALADALKATRFGHPFNRKPIRFTGYYTYNPAEHVTDQELHTVDIKDSAAVYAVFYRNHDAKGNAVVLDGTNIKTSPLIIATADMGYVKPQKAWTAFEVSFKYVSNIDLDVLEHNGYSLAIVFSSSKRGDQFIGAIGSTLCVDKVRIICEKEEK